MPRPSAGSGARRFPRWSKPVFRCRWHGCKLVPQKGEVPKFVAAIGRMESSRRAERVEYKCPVKGCRWVAVGEGECLVSQAFRDKEFRLSYRGME